MKLVKLGNTGIEVSRLCFGTLTMGPLQKHMPLNEGAALLELAFSLGVNFIDTAEIYGTYPYIKEALRIKPDAVICTKDYAYDKNTAEQSFISAVNGIGRDYIDIFLLHEQESEHTIRGHMEAIEQLIRRKEQGYIGALGLSTHYIAGVHGANKYEQMEVVFPLINRTGIGIADGTAEEMLKEIRISHQKGKGVIAMKPLGGGHLINDSKKALSYVLNEESIHTIAIGMQSEAEVLYNCAVFSGEKPSDDISARVSAAPRRLLIHDWCEGCGECVKRCSNKALSIKGGKAQVDPSRCALCGYCAGVCLGFCIKVV